MIGRLTQSLFQLQEAKLRIYVDDPAITLRGVQARRERYAAIVVLVWSALGLPIAIHKAARGSLVDWIGATFHIQFDRVIVSAKTDMYVELEQLSRDFLNLNVIPLRDVESYAGKCSHVASLLWMWRPFLRDLWGAISQCKSEHTSLREVSRKLKRCIWTKQITHVLQWILAFLTVHRGALTRIYTVDSWTGKSSLNIRIILDASPWGLGAYLMANGTVVAWYTSPISDDDIAVLSIERGSSSAQQAAEALALLVALRLWAPYWRAESVSLEVRSDSVSALILLMYLKTSGKATNIIAREVALTLGQCLFMPSVYSHTPGLSNIIADELSRRYQPGACFTLPRALQGARQDTPPKRPPDWWLSLRPPSAV